GVHVRQDAQRAFVQAVPLPSGNFLRRFHYARFGRACQAFSQSRHRNHNFSVKISIPLENTGVSSVFAASVWPFSLIFSLARRNEGNFFQAVPTTLSSSLAEVRLASLVAWA